MKQAHHLQQYIVSSMDSASFSPSLRLANLDYIAPSAVCVLPTNMATSSNTETEAPAAGFGGVRQHARHRPDEMEASVPAQTRPLHITLQDCLACSGCITTAETVLVAAQSREEIWKHFENDAHQRQPWLVSISEASAASIAAHVGCSMDEAYELVAGFFRERFARPSPSCGCSPTLPAVMVVDLEWATHLSTHFTAAEYLRRLQHEPETLPLMVSSCPGWVCYCEKQGGTVLKHLCPVLSPQGIAGQVGRRLLHHIQQQDQHEQEQVDLMKEEDVQLVHLSIQPCFDRKLEAARDFLSTAEDEKKGDDGNIARRVQLTDFVLSTMELMQWMREVDATLPWRAGLNSERCSNEASQPPPAMEREEWCRLEGSGGYYRRAMELAASGQPFCELDPLYETQRNRNHLLVKSGTLPQQTFCVAYGFQQIQNITRKLKRRRQGEVGNPLAGLTFVELMACPDGCLNGGGQARGVDGERCDVRAVQQAFSRRRTTTTSPAEIIFSREAIARVVKEAGESLWRCTFTDRQEAYEAALNAPPTVATLRW